MQIKQIITTVDTHTEGGPTRIVTSCIAPLKGASIAEKRDYFKSKYDDVRKCLVNHPRGYPGMFGAVLTEPSQPDAETGVFFLTNTGYLDMCVHSAIGVVAACLDTGMITPYDREGLVRLETPAGIISLWANYDGRELESVSIEPTPSFVHTQAMPLDIGLDRPVIAGIVFSAVFFILIDVRKIGLQVTDGQEEKLRELACRAIENANQALKADGADLAVDTTVDLAFLYEDVNPTCCRSAVYSKTGILDKSPCGAGTVAKMTLMHQRGELELNNEYTNESIFNTRFKGRVTQSRKKGAYTQVRSIISGSAYITGFHRFVVEVSDELHL